MASNSYSKVHDELSALLKQFRFRKATNNAAIIMKIDKESQMVVVDDDIEDWDDDGDDNKGPVLQNKTMEDLQELLPASQPRYLVYSYVHKHDDGRVSYPLCFIFVSPQGCKPEMQMMYAGSLTNVVAVTGLTKVFEVRSTEELTEEWLLGKLKLFG